MKLLKLLATPILALAAAAAPTQQQAQQPATQPALPPATLRSTLLHALHSTHDTADWFTPINKAVANLTADQARWVPTNAQGKLDPNANHSAGMLAFHLWYWNGRALARLQGKDPDKALTKYSGNNEETFNDFNATNWPTIVAGLDQQMKDIEAWVEHAPEADLARQAPMLTNLATHNAYHTGQILYVRKLANNWDAANGVR